MDQHPIGSNTSNSCEREREREREREFNNQDAWSSMVPFWLTI